MEPPVGTGDDEQRQYDDERQPFLRRQVEVVGEELEIDRRATMAAIAAAKAEPAVAEAIAGKTIAKEIYVMGRLVNIAVKG